jgi:hypothetical protein
MEILGRVPHFSRSLREVGIFAICLWMPQPVQRCISDVATGVPSTGSGQALARHAKHSALKPNHVGTAALGCPAEPSSADLPINTRLSS